MSTLLIRKGNQYFKVKVNPSPLLSGVSPASGIRYVVKKDREWNEWQVRAYVNGKYDEGKTYFAGDKEDAIETFNHFMQGRDVGKKNPEGTNLITLANRIAHVRGLRDDQRRGSDDYTKLNEMLKYLEAQYRQLRRGRLASAVRLSRHNPLLKSPHAKHVSMNIAYLMQHPEELTAKTKEGKRKQAVAIALDIQRRAAKTKRNPGKIYWFLVAGKHWITAIAKGDESPHEALRSTYFHGRLSETQIHVTKPDGWTPNEWRGAIHRHAVYHPEHTR